MTKKVTTIILLIAIIFAFYFLFIGQKRINNELTTINQNVVDITNELNKDRENFSYMEKIGNIDNYGGGVLQIGGVGSRFKQTSAYLLNEHGYLKPSEDWIKVSFNSPGDIMDVDCKENYTITSCTVNGKSNSLDNIFGCRAMIENKMQNQVSIECSKN